MAALVARRYYIDGRTKLQVADELGISRFKVARILDQARSEGIVRIEISAPSDVDLELSHRVATRFHLRQALVLKSLKADPETTRHQIGRACAALLAQRLTEQDVLGVSWGRTLHALIQEMPRLPPATVVQLVGSVPTADLNVNSLELVRQLGQSAGADVYPIHVPMILETPETAAALRSADHVRTTLAQFPTVTCALIGIGAWRPGGSVLRSALPPRLAESLDQAGAVADLCSTVLDSHGGIVGGQSVAARAVAITTRQLRAIPDVIALAGGTDKAPAIAATLKAGLVHRLITDTSAATALLTT